MLLILFDGILERLSEEILARNVAKKVTGPNPDPAAAVKMAITAAFTSGSTDNLTAMLLVRGNGEGYTRDREYCAEGVDIKLAWDRSFFIQDAMESGGMSQQEAVKLADSILQ